MPYLIFQTILWKRQFVQPIEQRFYFGFIIVEIGIYAPSEVVGVQKVKIHIQVNSGIQESTYISHTGGMSGSE